MPKKIVEKKADHFLYDYLNGDKSILTRDGKKPNVVILPHFSEGSFMHMGDTGFLTGEALKDYLDMKGGKSGQGITKNIG